MHSSPKVSLDMRQLLYEAAEDDVLLAGLPRVELLPLLSFPTLMATPKKVFLLGSVMAPDSTCFSFDRVNFLGELFPQNTDLFFSVGFLSVGGVGPVWLKCRSGADSAELSSFRYSR